MLPEEIRQNMGPHRRSSHDSGGDNVNIANDTPTDEFATLKFDSVEGPWPCGVPKGHTCLYANGGNSEHIAITKDDLVASEAIKIVCSNDQCPMSPFLHSACFTSFEETVLVYLKSQGRARGWSDKQRSQNLWTKRGYDLVYKACECSCGHGYVRRDLDWHPPSDPKGGGCEAARENANEEINGTKRKRKKSKSQSKGPIITIGLPAFGNNTGGAQANLEQHQPTTNSNNNNSNLANSTMVCSSASSTLPMQTQNIKTGQMVPMSTCNIVQPTLTSSAATYHQVNEGGIIQIKSDTYILE